MRLRETLLCGLGLLSFLGCEKRIPKEELGTVVSRFQPCPVPTSRLRCRNSMGSRIPLGRRPGNTPDGPFQFGGFDLKFLPDRLVW